MPTKVMYIVAKSGRFYFRHDLIRSLGHSISIKQSSICNSGLLYLSNLLRKMIIYSAKPHRSSQLVFKLYTVEPVLNGHSKIDKTQGLKTNDSLMEHSAILLACIK